MGEGTRKWVKELKQTRARWERKKISGYGGWWVEEVEEDDEERDGEGGNQTTPRTRMPGFPGGDGRGLIGREAKKGR